MAATQIHLAVKDSAAMTHSRSRFVGCALSLVAVVLIFLPQPRVAADDWPRFRGPSFNGISTETSWSHAWSTIGPNIEWSAQVGTGFSSCVVSDQRLFTIGNRENIDTVFCFDSSTGELLWTHSYDSPSDPNEFEGGPTSTPTVDGQMVFTLGRSGDLFALGAATGKVIWHKNIATENQIPIPTWGFAGSPLVDGERLIVNVADAGAAVHKKTGDLLWKSENRECGYSSPFPIEIGNQKQIVFGSGRSYVCVDPQTGKLQWRQRWLTTFGCNAADPIVLGDRLFLSSGYNRGSALLDIGGPAPQIIWKQKEMQNQLTTSVLIDRHLYGASGDVADGASLVCMDFESGQVRWKDDSIRVGGLSAAGDRLLVISDTGRLSIVQANREKFKLLAEHQVFTAKSWTSPVLAGGYIYCRSVEGQVVAIDVANR